MNKTQAVRAIVLLIANATTRTTIQSALKASIYSFTNSVITSAVVLDLANFRFQISKQNFESTA